MKTVGYSSGTGYLCQRDTLGRMRGIFGERRGMYGLGDSAAGKQVDLPDMATAVGSGAASGASVGILGGPIGSAIGAALGAAIGAGSQIWAANAAAESANKQALLQQAQALRAAGLAAQSQTQTQVAQSTTARNIAITAGAVAVLGIGAYIVYRMTRKA